MHFSAITATAVATLAFLATPAVAAATPATDLAARSAELDTRSAELEARAAALVCQFTGVQGCSIRCIGLGYTHGGYCSDTETCICNPSGSDDSGPKTKV
ncbi:MAG: hypothetical protein Q9213_005157 [Squamulea squamosa]